LIIVPNGGEQVHTTQNIDTPSQTDWKKQALGDYVIE